MLEKLEVFSSDCLRNEHKLDLIVEAKPHFCSAICASFALFAPDGSLVAQVQNVWGKLLSSHTQPMHELLWQISPSPLPSLPHAVEGDAVAFVSAWESTPVTQLLEKNLLPGLNRKRIIGPEEQDKACSICLADFSDHGPSTVLYEWTEGIDVKDLEDITQQSLDMIDRGLLRAVRRFREVVPLFEQLLKDGVVALVHMKM